MKFFSYRISDILIKILTFDYYVVKKVIQSEIGKIKDLTILDLGCGTGTLAKLFNEKTYLGFDIDPKAVFLAEKKFPNYKFKVGDTTAIHLDKKFDLVLIVGVLHHLNDKDVKKTAQNINSLLKENGKALIIEATHPLSLFNIPGLILRKLDKGDYVRSLEDYAKLLITKLTLKKKYSKKGGLFDYAVFVANFKGK